MELESLGLRACFQCGKCSAGCPLSGHTDLMPHALIRLLLLGHVDRVLASRALWLCTGCNTCVARCPNEVDLPGALDALRSEALARAIPPAEPHVQRFHDAFLRSVRKHGRLYELGMVFGYKLKTGTYTEDAALGMRMFGRGKLRLLPRRLRARREVKRLFERGIH